ncbi:MAG: DUF350 domain-containing protein [Magnetococcales bacterium]|nr:DUF350 domain-containing protein [Magnetococcales bacterium]
MDREMDGLADDWTLWDLINWNPDLWIALVMDLVVAVILMAGLRFAAGYIGHVSSREKLASRDNPAFGISLAAAVGAVALMMSGAIAGDSGYSLVNEMFLVGAYGIMGIFLLASARFIFDRFTLPGIAIGSEIMRGNLAAALADAGNSLATAIIVRAVMVWVDSNSRAGFLAVLAGYLVSQIVLTLATVLRVLFYARQHLGIGLETALKEGNTATALCFIGHRLGIALAVTAASGFVPFDADLLWVRILIWGGAAIMLLMILPILARLARLAILAGIDVVEEVDNRGNLGVAAIEAAIYMGVGILLATLLT